MRLVQKVRADGSHLSENTVAEELNISTQDILFVGNSVNDRFAYQSGAETLCINPKLVDITDNIVWNHNIIECKDLQEIIPFIRI